MGVNTLLTHYAAGIDEELSLFKNNALITEEYRKFVREWARASRVSGTLGGPTLEMERIIALNGDETVVDNDDGNALSAAIICPKNRSITVLLKHQSVIDLPIPNANVEIYEDASFAPDKRVSAKVTGEDGKAVFTDLTVGKSYYARAIDPDLEAHNESLLAAYDQLSLQQYATLSARWEEYRPQWSLNAITANLLATFTDGLFSSLTDLWSDIKLAWNIIADPGQYLGEIGDALIQAGEWVSGLTLPDFSGALSSSKEQARQLMALFNDEAALYLLTRATLLRIRMYPWGQLLAPLAEFAGEVLSGLIFGALLTLVTGPGGPAFLAYKVVKMLTRYGPRIGKFIQTLWNELTEIMEDMAKIMSGFLEKHGAVNHQRQSNGRLGPDHETDLGTSRHTEIDQQTWENNTPSRDANGNPTKNTHACDTDGCPVSLINGEELLALTDITLPGAVPFRVGRQYRTTAVGEASTLGFGWRHTLDHDITFTDSHILWRDNENATLRLPLPDQAIPASRNPLAGAMAWCGKEDDTYLLSAPALEGWLMHITRDPVSLRGQVTGFSRQRQHWQVEYRGTLPVMLVNTVGITLHLNYREHAMGPRLSSLVFENRRLDMARGSITVMRYDHDDQGRLCRAQSPGQEAEYYHYQDDHLFTCRELPSGAKFYWEWSGTGAQARAIRHWSSLSGLSREYLWQPEGRVTVRHEDGAEEHWRHDPGTARLLEQTDADGATTRYEYDTRGNLITLTDPLGSITRYRHNRNGQVTEERLPDGQIIRRYYSAGYCTEQVSYSADGLAKQRERWRYDADGCLLETTDAEGNTTHYRWSEEGVLTATEWADGSNETRHVNAAGLVLREKNRTGKITAFRYDLLCRPIWQGNPETGAGEQIRWNDAGHLENITRADGSQRHWTWNAYGQLLTDQDEDGHITRYDYYPGTALLSCIIRPDNTREQYNHDLRLGKVTNIIDGNGQHSYLRYTRTGRLAEEITFDGRRLCREYDASGRLTALREYDNSDREESLRLTQLIRDTAGRVTEKILPDGKKIRYGYDGFGRLISTDDDEWPLAWQYDHRGLLIAEHQGPASIHYQRDATGALTAMRLPDGRTVSWLRHHGVITATSLEEQLLTRHDWRNGTEHTRHNGVFRQHRAHDIRDRLIRQSVVMPDNVTSMTREYAWDARSLLSRITDTTRGDWQFSHDSRSRLATTTFTPRQPDGIFPWQESFFPDAADNLTGATTTENRTPGNRLTHHGDTRYEYDGYGNRILEVAGTEEHHYEWDTEHRLTGYRCLIRGLETVHFRYRYDSFGRRVLKEDLLSNTARRFFWQGERLLCECNAATFWPGKLPDNPFLQKKLLDDSHRVWLYEDENDFRPLMMLCGRQAQPAVYHYVCDHLGTPLDLRDNSGRIVWSALLRSYGLVYHIHSAQVAQPLRFQGQYHDGESGLYYNRHRYYDPASGRYLSPDPIGLAGGLNNYAYAPNPLSWIDPLGLKCSGPAVKLNRKLSALEKAQKNAINTRILPDGRIRYYNEEALARTLGPTRGRSHVTEWNPKNGDVRIWEETYSHSGQVNRVHPKMKNGDLLDLPHYPPTKADIDAGIATPSGRAIPFNLRGSL